MFSVNVLLYGTYPALALRCLRSIVSTADWTLIKDLRFGFNEVCPETRTLALAIAEAVPVPCHIFEEVDGKNVGKYPLMRRMFYDRQLPLEAEQVMWFDDDSYVTGKQAWWREVSAIANQHILVGSRYRIRSRGNQHAAIRNAPWYTGRVPFNQNRRMTFMQGGWWVMRCAELLRWNYPFLELHHNGGDSILGELCAQQGYSLGQFNRDVAINADENGGESAGVRRGMKTLWIWEDWVPGTEPDLSHQNFTVKVLSFERKRHTTISSFDEILGAPPKLNTWSGS